LPDAIWQIVLVSLCRACFNKRPGGSTMNLSEIKKSLDKMFSRELRQGHRRNIVFWYDESGAFADHIDELVLDNVH
jgi:hypothetical protein